ncbi:hypothetical protein ACIQI7_38375 [Kitasatospora sp. NPDC092039]|uniref:hypothetical protein n=1 Tax=Kitasatospora sp. NPDC092039 TaxID=3364086 RepID=UPI0038105695
MFASITADVEEIAHDCGTSTSTAYEALARLEALRLVEHPDPGSYRVNPRFFFASNPEIRRLVGEALEAPEITLDARAEGPRKVGNVDARRRRTIRAVPQKALGALVADGRLGAVRPLGRMMLHALAEPAPREAALVPRPRLRLVHSGAEGLRLYTMRCLRSPT